MSDPESIGSALKRLGLGATSAIADKITEAEEWRKWAIKTLNRIDLQDATNEQLQHELEKKLA